jgi:hypothetical protein
MERPIVSEKGIRCLASLIRLDSEGNPVVCHRYTMRVRVEGARDGCEALSGM